MSIERTDAIAIVGVGLRLPGGINNLNDLWTVLKDGRDVVTEVPADRFDSRRFVDPTPGRAGKSYTASGGFVHDIDQFDADYFGISPKEAAKIDPQQRMLLECAVEALDDAGIPTDSLVGSDTAVYTGISSRDYSELQNQRMRSHNAYVMTGSANCNAANRLSYFFDLRGPSTIVDTACASSLTAMHQAVEAIRTGRSGLALTGGVNALLGPGSYVGFSQASMLSPSGRCRPFSANADGFVRAEGAGIFVLKPLSAALADGDRIHGVIEGTGINADGRTAGLSLPNPKAQAELLAQVYGQAGIDADDVAYVEAHGTGTQAGDPIECEALGTLFAGRSAGPVPIGSVKSNVGHLEPAAGVAGVAKALLVLREQWIPQTLHSQPVSEKIDFAELGLDPVPTGRPLEPTGRSVVGVNSFGFGGANAHVIIAPAPQRAVPPPTPPTESSLVPIVISARTEPALTDAARNLADRLERNGAPYRDIAYTAHRRGKHDRRIAVLASDSRHAADTLRKLADGEPVTGAAAANAVSHGRIGFVFAGNASQWPGMGRDLLEHDAAFRAEVEACDVHLAEVLGWSVRDEIANPDPQRWQLTEIAQPVLFALQAGIVASLAARGVVPTAAVGHSVGEVAAAYCAGRLDRATACKVIAERSRSQQLATGLGRMAAAGLSAEDARARINAPAYAGKLVIAGVNSQRDVTIAGGADALAALGAELDAEGVFFRDLKLDYAFHSQTMDVAREPLVAALQGVSSRPGAIAFVSTVTGGPANDIPLDAGYWWRNVREPVLFAAAVQHLVGTENCDVLIEIGPHPVLSTYLRRIAGAHEAPFALIPTLSRTNSDAIALDTTVAHAIAAGARTEPYFAEPGQIVDLPAYPWQRERHWSGEPQWWLEDAGAESSGPAHPLLGARQPAVLPSWHQRVDVARFPWVTDHLIGESVIVPGTAYIEMAISSAERAGEPVEVVEMTIPRALPLPVDDPSMDVHLQSSVGSDGRLSIASRVGGSGEWTTHAQARTRPLLREQPSPFDLHAARARLHTRITHDEFYEDICQVSGLPYGPAFKLLTSIDVSDNELLAEYRTEVELDGYAAHPVIVDGGMHATLPLVAAATGRPIRYLPSRVGAVRYWQAPPAHGYIHIAAGALDSRELKSDITITDTDGNVMMQLLGVVGKRFDNLTPPSSNRYAEGWRAAPLPGVRHRTSPLPDPTRVIAAKADALHALDAGGRPERDTAFSAECQLMAARFTVDAIATLLPDVVKSGVTEFGLPELLAAGVRPEYEQLLQNLIGDASALGLLTATGPGQWRLHTDRVTGPDAFVELLRHHPYAGPVSHVFAVCGRALPDVLRGAQDPLELLFSDADGLAGRWYDYLPAAIHVNQVAATLLREALAQWPVDRPLRVLEVGAGTGGTTAHLAPVLPRERTHYTYTDISPAFFPKAKSRFAGYDFIDYQRLDLDADPAEQGFADGTFDIIVASNVLHATRDLRVTMQRVADLLAEGGQLWAIECHSERLLGPIFGLLDSYWGGADADLRPNGPLLSPTGWERLLPECGFAGSVQIGDLPDPANVIGSLIIATRAQRDVPLAIETPVPTTGEGQRLVAALDAESVLADALITDLPGAVRVAASDDPTVWTELLAAGPAEVVLLTSARSSADAAVRHTAVLRAVAIAAAQAPESAVWIVAETDAAPQFVPPTGASAATALWGAARSVANEINPVPLRRVAVSGGSESAAALIGELTNPSAEDEIMLTAAGRFVPRAFDASVTPVAGEPASNYILDLANPGLQNRLSWIEDEVLTPGPDQVIVKVGAAALNYRDIMISIGQVPPFPYTHRPGIADLGLECAGTVVAVGAEVDDVAVGDRVMAMAVGCFASHALVRRDHLIPIPDSMSFAEAATMPIVFTTVIHSLPYLTRLEEGETILIHGAAGAVGLAAIQHARNIGARVIATAGTPAKRDLLRLLGAEHVLDSRSLAFADEVMDLTHGEGVDVVLNSIAGEAMIRSLKLVKPYGRFIELGKRDFLEDNPLPLAPFINNIAYHGVDVSAMCRSESAIVDRHIAALKEGIWRGEYYPLPYLAFPAARIGDAFACLRHSRHIGKVVVTFDADVPVAVSAKTVALDPSATYLITGGTGGFGAATARRLARRGARHLTLVSRRGGAAPEVNDLLADLHEQGVEAAIYAADAGDVESMERIFADIDAGGRRIGGVVHAAMVLHDAPLATLTDEQVAEVYRPKLVGGLILDELTRDRDLDFFVVYSSATTFIGNADQAPYVAANLVLDAIADDRHRRGVPGQSVRWGSLGDTGFVHRNQLDGYMDSRGLALMRASDALDALETLLVEPTPHPVMVGELEWPTAMVFLPGLKGPRFATVAPEGDSGESGDQLQADLAAAASEEEAAAIVEDVLAEIFALVLQTTADRVDRGRRLDQLGVDSLMAAEIGTRIQQRLSCSIPTVEITSAQGLAPLARRVLSRISTR